MILCTICGTNEHHSITDPAMDLHISSISVCICYFQIQLVTKSMVQARNMIVPGLRLRRVWVWFGLLFKDLRVVSLRLDDLVRDLF